MAQFDLAADVWTEVIAAGGSSDQMIVLSMGEALVSLGVPDATTQAIKMGGASRRSLLDARIYIAPAGFAVWMRPIGARVIFSTGASIGGIVAPYSFALILANDGQYIIANDGQFILGNAS